MLFQVSIAEDMRSIRSKPEIHLIRLRSYSDLNSLLQWWKVIASGK